MKSNKVISALLGSCLALSLTFAPVVSAADAAQASTDNRDLINEVMNILENYNLSGVDKDTLIRGAIDGMVNTWMIPIANTSIPRKRHNLNMMLIWNTLVLVLDCNIPQQSSTSKT